MTVLGLPEWYLRGTDSFWFYGFVCLWFLGKFYSGSGLFLTFSPLVAEKTGNLVLWYDYWVISVSRNGNLFYVDWEKK